MGEKTLEDLGFSCNEEYIDTYGKTLVYFGTVYSSIKEEYIPEGKGIVPLRIMFSLKHKMCDITDVTNEGDHSSFVPTDVYCAITNKMKDLGWI